MFKEKLLRKQIMHDTHTVYKVELNITNCQILFQERFYTLSTVGFVNQ